MKPATDHSFHRLRERGTRISRAGICALAALAGALFQRDSSAGYYNLGAFWQNSCGGTVKLVQSAGPQIEQEGDSQSLALGSNEKAGDLLVAVVTVMSQESGAFDYTLNAAVTDSAGNVWYPGPVWNNSIQDGYWANPAVQIWYAPNVQAGANTVSAVLLPSDPGPSNTSFDLTVLEYSGIATTDVVDGAQGNVGNVYGSTNNITSGTLTTTTSCDLVVAGALAWYQTSATVSSPWRPVATDSADLDTYIFDNLPSGARAHTAVNAAVKLSSTDEYWALGEMAFRAASTTAPAQPTKLAFTTAAQSDSTWSCSGATTVTAESSSGAPTNTSTGLSVNLTGGGTSYFYDSGCQYPISQQSSQPTIRRVQYASTACSSSSCTVGVNPTKAGDLIVVVAFTYPTIGTITSTTGEPTVSAGDGCSDTINGPQGVDISYSLNAVGGASSITVNSSGTLYAVEVLEYTGPTAWSFDVGAKTNNALNGSNDLDYTPALTTSLANDVVIGGIIENGEFAPGSPITGAGWTTPILDTPQFAGVDDALNVSPGFNTVGGMLDDGNPDDYCSESLAFGSGSPPSVLIGSGTNSATYYFESAGTADNQVTVSDPSDTNGLVGWWKFDDGSGTSAADSSGNGNTGTLQHTPTWVPGYLGDALQFNGTNQDVKVPDAASLDLPNSWTVSAWVNFAALPASGKTNVVVYKGGASQVNYEIGLDNGWFTDGLNWDVQAFATNGEPIGASAPASGISLNTWYHIAGVWDSSAQFSYLYVNGALVSSGQNYSGATPDGGAGNPVYIGYFSNFGGSAVHGTLDDVRIYNVALTQEQIASVMNDRELPTVSQTETINIASHTWVGNMNGACSGNWPASASATASDKICWSDDTMPGVSATAHFDGTCTTNCSPTITGTIDVGGIWLHSGYAGAIAANASTVHVEGNGYRQDAGGFTFTSGSLLLSTLTAGTFLLNGGSFTAPNASGAMSVGNVFEVTGSPAFNANGGTVIFSDTEASEPDTIIPGSLQFNNVTFSNANSRGPDVEGTMYVNGTLTVSNDAGTGFSAATDTSVIAVKGNVVGTSGAIDQGDSGGSTAATTLQMAGTTNQSITESADCLPGQIQIANTGSAGADTVSLLSNLSLTAWSYKSGAVNTGTNTVTFEGYCATANDSVTQFYNVTTEAPSYGCGAMSVTGTMNITNALTLDNGGAMSGGTLSVAGNLSMSANGGGTSAITFVGGSAQTYTRTGGSLPTGTITLDKVPGTTLTLESALALSSGQTLKITSGTLDLNGQNLTGSPALKVGSTSPFALVQSAGPGYSSPSTTSATLAQNETVGNMLIAGVYWDAYSTVTLSDTAGNSWTPMGIYGGNICSAQYLPYIQLWYAPVTVAGANTISVTENGSPSYQNDGVGVFVAEYSGLGPLDAAGGQAAPSSSNAMSSGNITTTATDLIVGLFMDPNGTGTMPAGSGFTSRLTDPGYYSMLEDNAPSGTSAGSVSATGNLPSGSDSCWQAAVAAFSVASAVVKAQGGETVTTSSKTFNTGSTALYYGSGTYASLNLGNAYSNLSFSSTGSGSWTLANNATVSGNLTLAAGTLGGATKTLTVDGNWVNSGGAFTPGTSTVTFSAGSSHTISGSNSFDNLTMDDSADTVADTLTFQSGKTATVSGTLTLKGNTTSQLKLRSSNTGTQWNINPSGTRTVSRLDVEDSDNTNANWIAPTNSTNSGDNTNWDFGTTIAYVQKTSEGDCPSGCASQSASFGSLPATGDAVLVYAIAWNPQSNGAVSWPAGGVTDNQGNTYSLAAANNYNTGTSGGYYAAAIYYTTGIGAPSGTFTVTGSPSASAEVTIVAVEYSGMAKTDALDQSASNSGETSSATSGTTGSTAQTNELSVAVLAFACGSGTCTASTPTGYTSRLTDGASGDPNIQASDKVLSATGTQSASWTTGGAGNSSPYFSAAIATFRGD